MASDVLITPSAGLIQFSSSAGSGSGAIKVDGDNLVISNELGDVLLGDGASDVFIGDGTNNVDIVFEQNGEIRDDGSGKSIILGSKTTNVFITSSTSIILQKDTGLVGIGTATPTKELQVEGSLSASFTGSFGRVEADSFNITSNLTSLTTSGNISGSLTSTGSFGKIVGNSISLPNNSISGDVVEGGTIASITISQLGGALDVNNENITNIDVNSGAIDGTTIGAASATTIKGTTIDATTDFTIGGTVITDNKIADDGTFQIDAATDITLDAAGKDINLTDGSGTAEFIFNLEDAPELDVDGDFTIDGSGKIKLDSATSIIETVGNITASGVISSSGNIFGDIFNSNGKSAARYVSSNNTQFISDDTVKTEIKGTSVKFNGAITASGDISASGDVLVDGTGSFGEVITTGPISSSHSIIAIGFSANADLAVTGEGYRIGGQPQLTTTATNTTLNLGVNNDLTKIQYGKLSPAHNFTGNITSSGNISASGFISASSFAGDGAGITNVSATVSGDTFATDLKIGRDSTDLIDFATADNVIGFRVGDNDEMKLTTTALHPATSNGSALGLVNRQWSDLFLAEGAVINFDNGDVTMTQTGNKLAIAGTDGTSFVGDITASGNISSSGDVLADQFFSNGLLTLDINGTNTRLGVNSTTTGIVLGKAGTNTSITATGNITASGVISASGAIKGGSLDINGGGSVSGDLVIGRHLSHDGDSDTKITFETNTISFVAGNTTHMGFTETGGTQILTNITASGDISSSGTITAASFNSLGSNLSLNNITASGNISGSSTSNITVGGTITAEQLTSTDDITATGNITSNTGAVVLTAGNLIFGASPIIKIGGSNALTLSANTTDLSTFQNCRAVSVPGLETAGNITASGNISASGTIITEKLNVNPFSPTSPNMSFGNWNIGYGAAAELTGSLASDGNGYGEIAHFGNGPTLAGRVYCLKSDSTWEVATDTGPVSSSLLAVAMGTHASASGMLLRGVVKGDRHDTLTVGQKVYNEGNGRIAPTAGSDSGDVVRVLGYVLNATNDIIYFNPDNTWVEIA